MLETKVGSLAQEDPLEKEMATHSSVFTWEIPWTEEPGRLQPVESKKSDTEQLSTHAHLTLPWLKEKKSTASILQQWAKGGLHQHNLEGWFQILIPSVIPSRLRRQSGVNLMSLVVVKLPGCR